MFFGDYGDAADEKLAELARNNDQRAFSEILGRYRAIMINKVQRLTVAGMDNDDLMQECALGLLDAVMCYSESKGASLKTFASVCIDNRLRSVIRRISSEKNRVLNECVDLTEEVVSDDSDTNPETMMLLQENANEQTQYIESILSKREYMVFVRFMSGMSYNETAADIGISVKAVDNALSRARVKLKQAYEKRQ